MASDPAEEDQTPYAHKDLVQHNPILWAQMIEARREACVAMALLCQPMLSQTSVGCCSEGAQGGGKHVSTMEVDRTNYRQLDVVISDHPLVTAFHCGQGRMMNYRDAFNTVKQAKAFCWEHFNGLNLQAVNHPWEHHCATVAWGGRAKGAHVCIIRALLELYQAQSQMRAQQTQDVPLNQIEVVCWNPPKRVHTKCTLTKSGSTGTERKSRDETHD